MQISAKIKTQSTLTAKLYCSTVNNEYKRYSGEYEVTPKTEAQELETANKLMGENIKVLAIPFYEVSNKDGTTAIIAD